MKLERRQVQLGDRHALMRSWLSSKERRLGLITSINGEQLVTLVLDLSTGTGECWESPVDGDDYPSLTPMFPQCHWHERAVWDLFGLHAKDHPRLKHLLLHEAYDPDFLPLRTTARQATIVASRKYDFLKVEGDGVYEIPVGPIHAGVIEPGHFRLSCLGEVVLNLEIRLGFLHRGVEKRMTEVPWQNARFVAEAAASDTAVANALAHAIAVESLLALDVPPRAQYLRSIALEIERAAMHIIDVGGMGVDIGMLGVASALGKLRGNALALADLIAGSRFMRGYILPGGIYRDVDRELSQLCDAVKSLRKKLEPVLAIFMETTSVQERLEGVGKLSPSLARDFGLVGVGGRASGIAYDARQHFGQGIFPRHAPPIAVETQGDVRARIKVRIAELFASLNAIEELVGAMPQGPTRIEPPRTLPPDAVGAGVVEAFRGETIHLAFTDGNGRIMRYAIKDPSFNNWTGLSIAVRNQLVADFPICNKSFSLSYSGHDL